MVWDNDTLQFQQLESKEGIEKLANEDLQIGLAISLHAPNNELRKKLVPTATKDSVKEIIDAGHYYFKKDRTACDI